MAILNAWQKLTRVLPGKPFGNGSDGAYSSATIPTLTKDSCSGTATSTTLTTAGSTFANGDILLIHQTRGTGVGQWEINRVASGGGSTSLTLQVALNYTYTDSGASQAQAIKIPQYSSVTVQSGTWTVPSWDGNVGGILAFANRGTLTVTGNITGAGKGYLGGIKSNAYPGQANQGEGTAGGGSASTSANGTGGGGCSNTASGVTFAGGGGGGHSASGTTGVSGTNSTPGSGGGTSGSTDLISLVFGGGGGGGGGNPTTGAGGVSGGSVMVFSKVISMSGSISVNGGAGENGSGSAGSGGGGGSGGSALLVCERATLGTNLVTSSAGAGGTGIGTGKNGGAGSVGYVAVHHSSTVTGTTSPTFTDVTDTTLKESTSGMFLVF